VEVYKNQSADMIAGGIAGTVNLNTRKAFDADGRVFSFTADYTPNDSLAFNFDAQYVDSTMEIENVSVMGATRAVVGMDLRGSGVPNITLYPLGYDGQGSEISDNPFTDPSKNFWRNAMDHLPDNEGDELSGAGARAKDLFPMQ
jgi:iron complex outermembrane receptor protein